MKTKKLFINEFVIKILGLLFMTLDHIGLFLMNGGYFPSESLPVQIGLILRYIGRLAFPLFAFMVAIGIEKTHDRLNYILRLSLIMAALLIGESIIFAVDKDLGSSISGNAFLDLTAFALIIYLLEHPKKGLRFLAILPIGYLLFCYGIEVSKYAAAIKGENIIFANSIPSFLLSDYNLFGLALFLLFYYSKKWSKKLITSFAKTEDESLAMEENFLQGLTNSFCATFLVLVNLFFWALAKWNVPDPYTMGIQSYSALAAIIIIFYNGKRGYDKKWWRIFNYLYYPVHMILIWAIFALCFL